MTGERPAGATGEGPPLPARSQDLVVDGYGSVLVVLLPPVEVVGATVVEGAIVVGGAIVVVGAVVVVVVGPGTQPVTQKTLCLTSAPWDPSALMVSLTCT